MVTPPLPVRPSGSVESSPPWAGCCPGTCGFSSGENRRYLQHGAGGYIIAEKLRSGSADIKAALSRQGRYQAVAGNLQVKEVRIDDAGDRFVICYNPEAATRGAATRVGLTARLEDMISGSDKLTRAGRIGGRTPRS